ncbi:MAG: formylglycine-generating enzyme family protein [Lysobacterales bacterium]
MLDSTMNIGRVFRRFCQAMVVCVGSLGGLVGAAETVSLVQGSMFKECDQCPPMVVIPKGTFLMGFDGGEDERYEGPEHEVTIANSFAAGMFPVTVGQFAYFVEQTQHQSSGCWIWDGVSAHFDEQASWSNPGYGKPPTPEQPVVCVNWTDADAYVSWLAEQTDQPYRLLSEAEWEYLAWAGDRHGRFAWGDDPAEVCLHANVFDRAAAAAFPDAKLKPAPCDDGFPGVAPVGQFRPNALGVYDMIGNSWEWVQDCYVMPYPDNVPVDGQALIVDGAACDRRGVRGGSWITALERQRPTFRGRDPENLRSRVFGLRVGRDLR